MAEYVLWNKVNQRPSAGVIGEQVVFPKGTSGDITISIHNIKSTHHNVPTDSVDFAGKVVVTLIGCYQWLPKST